MKRFLALAALAIAVPAGDTARAQAFPDWSVKQICQPGDSGCPRFELRARGEVSGLWPTLPPDARSTCLAETERVERSYRLLIDCLAGEMQRRARAAQRQR